jgi:hypothetical protein
MTLCLGDRTSRVPLRGRCCRGRDSRRRGSDARFVEWTARPLMQTTSLDRQPANGPGREISLNERVVRVRLWKLAARQSEESAVVVERFRGASQPRAVDAG